MEVQLRKTNTLWMFYRWKMLKGWFSQYQAYCDFTRFSAQKSLKTTGVDPLTTFPVGRSYKIYKSELVRRWHMVLQGRVALEPAWPSWDLLSSACPWWHDLLCQINKQPSQLAPYWRTNISSRHTNASALHCHVMPSCILMQQVIQHESNIKHGLCDPFHH